MGNDAYTGRRAASKKRKAKPGCKRIGKDMFVPVTMKFEPSELSTIEMIAKASRRSRSDVMREMVTLGMQQMLETVFAPKSEEESRSKAVIVPVMDPAEDVGSAPDNVRAQTRVIEAIMPAAKASTATREHWAELALRSAAILCIETTGEAGNTPEEPLRALAALAAERADADRPPHCKRSSASRRAMSLRWVVPHALC